MANQVGPATAGESMAGAGAGSAGSSAGTDVDAGSGGAGGRDAEPFVSQAPGIPVSFVSFHGRPVSWVAVSLIMAAFVAGGLALVFGPTWWLFWAALGVSAIGGLLALSVHIFDDWY